MAGAGGGQTTYEVVVKADGAELDGLQKSIQRTTAEMEQQAKAAAKLAKENERAAKAAAKAQRDAAKAAAAATAEWTGIVKSAGLAGVDWATGLGAARSGLASVGEAASAAKGKIAAFAAGVVAGTAGLMKLAAEGEKLKTIDAAFRQLGGSTKELEKMRELTGGMVGDTDLQKAASLAKLFKLPAQEIPALIKVAQGAAVAMGETTAKMLSDTFTAASRQSKMIADNMGIVMGDLGKVYDDFAKKIGKTSGDQLTDAQRTQAFVAKMVSEGGRQMELATLAQSNVAEKAAVTWDNLSGNMMVAVAEMARSLGVWDMLGAAMKQLEGFVVGNAAGIGEYLKPAFEGLFTIVPPILKALASMIPILEPLGQVLKMVGIMAGALAPAFGAITTIVAKVATVVLDLMTFALGPLLETAGAVVGMFDGRLGNAMAKAGEAMSNARVYIDANTQSLKEQEAQAQATADALAGLTGKVTMQGEAGAIQKALLDQANESMKQAEATGKAMTRAQYDSMAREQATAMAQYLAANRGKMTKLAEETVKQYGDAGDKGMKEAARKMALAFLTETGAEKDKYGFFAKEDLDRAQKAFEAAGQVIIETDQRAKDELRKQDLKALRDREVMMAQSAVFGTDILAETMMQGVESEKAALDKLEQYHDEHAEKIARLFEGDADALARAESALAEMVDMAGVNVRSAFENKNKGKEKGRGGGGRAPDYLEAEYAARLQLADESERKIIEIETRYQDMAAKLRADDHDTRIALTWQMVDEIAKAEEEIARAKEEAVWRVQQYLMSADQAAHMQRLRDIEMQAAEMKRAAEAAGAGPEIIGGIDQKAQAEASAARIEPLLALRDKLGGMASAVGESAGGMYKETLEAMEEETKARTQRMADLFQTMGTSIGDTMMQIAVSGEDMRDSAFKLMGQLFGQLSTAFLAWATAEGSLLAGNPFAAATAAIALGLVGSAISAFGSRGKSSGAKGGTSGMSQAAMDRRKQDKEKEASVVIYNYGFSTPDQIARSVSRGEGRGRDLEGRRRATA